MNTEDAASCKGSIRVDMCEASKVLLAVCADTYFYGDMTQKHHPPIDAFRF